MAGREQRVANARYYRDNRGREIDRVRQRQAETRDALRGIRDRPCADCGNTFLPHQMDFDHREPNLKSFRLTSGAAMLASTARIEAEVAKCDVVCANCHRLRTQRREVEHQQASPSKIGSAQLLRRRRYWHAQADLLDSLKARACSDCGRMFPPCAMDFDHRLAKAKRQTVSRMIGRAGTATILAEVDKCDIVCANCHRDRTFRRREAGPPERE